MDYDFSYERKHDWAVCIDSDGSLMDSMELKHKECFCPATVNVWNLQPVSKAFREEWDFVNLYSRYRGCNRFQALVYAVDFLFEREDVRKTGLEKPDLTDLKEWMRTAPEVSSSAIHALATEDPGCSPCLKTVAEWSDEIDFLIRRIARNVRPFAYVREAIATLGENADIIVVSAATQKSLLRDLGECGIDRMTASIMGQEAGTKAQSIARILSLGYGKDHVLKIGDAPGDLKAARDNGVLFYPIVAGEETESWKELEEKYACMFLSGEYKGKVMDGRVEYFLSKLPEKHF